MKKSLGKPENWQDFESLCKKLWGEMWEIPNKIKKNGRQGQEQAGVDVYGIPKGESHYWGIQAKGKDDYSNAKLTELEIVKEIEKARLFEPSLAVYIIATTANKDAKIERFVRVQDIGSQKNNSFEILLFCWEDIADLIEEHPKTFHYYLHGIGQKGKFDFKILFNDFQDCLTLEPTFEKETTQYVLTELTDGEILLDRLNNRGISLDTYKNIFSTFNSNRINKSWCKFEIIMENIGSVVIEDWSFRLTFKEGVRKINEGHPLMPIISMTTFVNNDNTSISYNPRDNEPLIQKGNRHFEISILPEHRANKIVAEWTLLARDFDRTEQFEIKLQPKFVETTVEVQVNKDNEVIRDEIKISDYVIEKK